MEINRVSFPKKSVGDRQPQQEYAPSTKRPREEDPIQEPGSDLADTKPKSPKLAKLYGELRKLEEMPDNGHRSYLLSELLAKIYELEHPKKEPKK